MDRVKQIKAWVSRKGNKAMKLRFNEAVTGRYSTKDMLAHILNGGRDNPSLYTPAKSTKPAQRENPSPAPSQPAPKKPTTAAPAKKMTAHQKKKLKKKQKKTQQTTGELLDRGKKGFLINRRTALDIEFSNPTDGGVTIKERPSLVFTVGGMKRAVARKLKKDPKYKGLDEAKLAASLNILGGGKLLNNVLIVDDLLDRGVLNKLAYQLKEGISLDQLRSKAPAEKKAGAPASGAE